jgi:hypothetical protein
MDNLDDIKDCIDIPKDIDLAIKKGIERGKEEKKSAGSKIILVKAKKGLRKATIVAYKIALPTVDEPEILDQYKVKIDLEK